LALLALSETYLGMGKFVTDPRSCPILTSAAEKTAKTAPKIPKPNFRRTILGMSFFPQVLVTSSNLRQSISIRMLRDGMKKCKMTA
jgi:hypothetical protein